MTNNDSSLLDAKSFFSRCSLRPPGRDNKRREGRRTCEERERERDVSQIFISLSPTSSDGAMDENDSPPGGSLYVFCTLASPVASSVVSPTNYPSPSLFTTSRFPPFFRFFFRPRYHLENISLSCWWKGLPQIFLKHFNQLGLDGFSPRHEESTNILWQRRYSERGVCIVSLSR